MSQVGIFRYSQDSYAEPSYFLPRVKCRELKDAGKGEFINRGKGFRFFAVKINPFITSNLIGFWHNEHRSKLPRQMQRKLGISQLHVTSRQCS
jgi:hypothetical protein